MGINANNIGVNAKKQAERTPKCKPTNMGGDSTPHKKRNAKHAALVKETARINGVSTRTVYYVIEGDRLTDQVFATYMTLLEGHNALIDEVKRLVPFPLN
jgi:hypothetical protein